MSFFNSTAKLVIDPEYRRITLQPTGLDRLQDTRFLYTYKTLLFTYLKSPIFITTTTEMDPIKTIDDIFEKEVSPIRSYHASQPTEEPKNGDQANEHFYRIEIWSDIHPKYQDIFLIYELAKLYHQSTWKKGQKPAREYAQKKMSEYIRKYLAHQEQEALNEIARNLPEKMNVIANIISPKRRIMEVVR